MLGRLTDSLPDDALFRLADPTARWADVSAWATENNRRCYVGHVTNHRRGRSIAILKRNWPLTQPQRTRAQGQYDLLRRRFGLSRVVRAIRLRAERELSRRGLVPHERAPQPTGEMVTG